MNNLLIKHWNLFGRIGCKFRDVPDLQTNKWEKVSRVLRDIIIIRGIVKSRPKDRDGQSSN